MDYNHLDISKIDLKANGIKIVDGVIYGNIEHIKASERCGFELNHFEGKANVSANGIVVDQVKNQNSEIVGFCTQSSHVV
jgi:hypothetical protein